MQIKSQYVVARLAIEVQLATVAKGQKHMVSVVP